MKHSFEGKVAFVTGAASGIGLAIAKALLAAGAKVMLCDISADALEVATSDLPKETQFDLVVADVSQKDDLRAAAKRLEARFGRLDLLFNNAGVGGAHAYGKWKDEHWNWVLGVNLMGAIYGVEVFAPLIEAHGEGGHIVNTASMAGLTASTNFQYLVSKHAVVGFSEGLRLNMAPLGIGVSVLCPGFVSTKINHSEAYLPKRFAGSFSNPVDAVHSLSEEEFAYFEERNAAGLSTEYVAGLTLEAVANNWFWIFTETEFEAYIDERHAEIKAAFRRIRD